jgi:hypothetical protein
MRNIFSATEEAPQLDPAFQNQLPANLPSAPSTPAILPAHPAVELRTPDFEDLARRSAPGHAASADLTYRWR